MKPLLNKIIIKQLKYYWFNNINNNWYNNFKILDTCIYILGNTTICSYCSIELDINWKCCPTCIRPLCSQCSICRACSFKYYEQYICIYCGYYGNSTLCNQCYENGMDNKFDIQ